MPSRGRSVPLKSHLVDTKERWRGEMVSLVSSTSLHTINREGKTNKHLSFFPKQHNTPTSHRIYHVLDIKSLEKKKWIEVEQTQVLWWGLGVCDSGPSAVPVDNLILILRNCSMFNDIICVLTYRQRSHLSLEFTNSNENSKLFEDKQK